MIAVQLKVRVGSGKNWLVGAEMWGISIVQPSVSYSGRCLVGRRVYQCQISWTSWLLGTIQVLFSLLFGSLGVLVALE